MARGLTFDNDLLNLIFNGTAISNIADNASTSPLTNLYVSLHNADPGVGGNQTTHETSYGGYARVAVARSAGGWTVTSNSVSPAADIVFPTCTSGSDTITYVGVGTVSSGSGKLLYILAVSPSGSISVGVSPKLTTASTITEN